MIIPLFALAVTLLSINSGKEIFSLQSPHQPFVSPSSLMKSIAEDCETLGIEKLDVYGDFNASSEESYLRQFEKEISTDFGVEDAVFMPSGVMAQSIALLIHSRNDTKKLSEQARNTFACHHTSHLLLHENEGYKELLGMNPLIISTIDKVSNNGYSVDPITYNDVKELVTEEISTLIIELPHREIGGKLTPWKDILRIKALCSEHNIRFHCDGARLFEASAGYGLDLKEICKPFDSIYISFYKGAGGISGAMLLGNKEFCNEARTWLRRFGGNLYTLLPYAVSGWSGYRKNIVEAQMTFKDKQEKMKRIVSSLLSTESDICDMLAFDPEVPQTNMVHGFLKALSQDCLDASDRVEKKVGINVLKRIRSVEKTEPAYSIGYRSKFELTIGNYNCNIDDDIFVRGWKEFLREIKQNENFRHKGV